MFFLQYFRLLDQHISYKHATNKPWKCDECDFAHAAKYGLTGHKAAVHPKMSDLKLCHICDYKAVTNQNLKNHIEAIHEKNKIYPCKYCNEVKTSKNSLRGHITGLFYYTII